MLQILVSGKKNIKKCYKSSPIIFVNLKTNVTVPSKSNEIGGRKCPISLLLLGAVTNE